MVFRQSLIKLLIYIAFIAIQIILANNNKIRILSFGDSITCGNTIFDTNQYPYTDTLNKIFIENNLNAEVVNNCHSGAVTDIIFPLVEDYLKKDRNFQIVIIYIGNNDIDQIKNCPKKPINEITYNVFKVYDLIKSKHIKLVIILIPQNKKNAENPLEDEIRIKYNNSLIEYYNSNKGFGNVYLCDLRKFFDWKSASYKDREMISDGGFHFSQLGYELLGKFIYKETLKKIIDNINTDKNKIIHITLRQINNVLDDHITLIDHC